MAQQPPPPYEPQEPQEPQAQNWGPIQNPQSPAGQPPLSEEYEQWGKNPPDQKPPKKPIYKRAWFLILAAVVGVIVLAAIFSDPPATQAPQATRAAPRVTQAPAPTKPEPTTPQGDGSAILACDHFANVADDIASGVLTPEQVTTKLGEVYGTAKRSETPGIAQASQDLLAAWNRADVDGIAASSKRLKNACAKVGH